MLQRSSLLLCMSVGAACRTMGFRAPPRDKKELKARFLALAKEHHPDQNADTAGESTTRMIQVTDAYRTLKQLLDTGGGLHAKDMHSAVNAMQQRRARGETDPSMEEVAASFVVPGSSLSLHGFTLPWQRMATQSKVSRTLQELDRARDLSFGAYVSAVRAVEKERSHREDARRRDAKMAEGSHGFTADYFEQLDKARRQLRRGADTEKEGAASTGGADLGQKLSTGTLPLAFRFYGRRLSLAVRNGPRKSWDALRYVVFGH